MGDIMLENILSPAVLFFLMGILAAVLKSDLKFPGGLSEGLSIYLLIAIGLKGGMELSHYSFSMIKAPMAAALILGGIIPIITLLILRGIKLDLKNSIGLAATYGSISIVTYGAAVSFLDKSGIPYEGFMNALVVLMESPAILVSLLLLKMVENSKGLNTYSSQRVGFLPTSMNLIDKEVLRESLFGKSILLLMGSMLIGLIVGERSLPMVKPLFMDLYGSVLILFLLNMGLVAGQRLPEIRKHGVKLLVFGLMSPLLFGSIGVMAGVLAGLGIGGVTLMGVLAGSASYIAAPAALKTSVPEANPSIYLGLALGVTFPFNLIIGIPFYYEIAQRLL
ncbi:sodium-dependent bicarbonate transport family permease [Bacillus sp. SCS-153A]|uniref:sodium-dependent bicarbonate transport family permease n=1 Tax=Rossellomorea sedimentorum TaxID=3115294 RepID=UPI003906105F